MKVLAERPPTELAKVVDDRWTAPFWAAARQHKLTCAQCGECGHFRMPPTPFCPECHSQEVTWPELPATGTLYSYTVIERAAIPAMETNLPIVPAVVELDGAPGTRLITNLVDCPVEDIRIGMQLTAVFDHVGDNLVIPRFTPAG